MLMKHAGLDISDDAIRCLEYSGHHFPNLKISRHSSVAIPDKVVGGGEINDEKAFDALLDKFDKENNLSYVKVSIPEEKAYLFQTDVMGKDPLSIAQNVEFKLEENVPLSVSDAVFYFDILPMSVTGGALRASVSVVPRVYVEKIIAKLNNCGMVPVAFEVVPKSIAKAIIPANSTSTIMIIHVMNNKTGVYIVAGGVVCFTSTVAWGGRPPATGAMPNIDILTKEIGRIATYWVSHGIASSEIKQILLVGGDAPKYQNEIKEAAAGFGLTVGIGNAWSNSFSLDHYIPAISREESLDYAVVAGLAMEL